jgi:hypothetical protein
MASQVISADLTTTPAPVRWHRVVGLGILFAVAVNLWVLHSELRTGASNIAGGNPPVPVLLALTLLLPLRRWLKFSDAELLAFYIFACFALLPTTFGGVRSFFPSLTTPLYYATPDNRLKEFWVLLPDWWVPKDSAIIKGFFEGMEGRIPWDEWLPPLLRWTVFFVGLWAISYGLAWLLAPQWLVTERLNFPLAQLPLQMVRGVEGRNFFASKLVWFGIFLGAMPTAIMALFSLFREVRRFWDLAPYLTDRPFNALRPLMIFPLVEGVGFGYLVPQEVLLSVWFFYFVLKLIALVGVGVFGVGNSDGDGHRRLFPVPALAKRRRLFGDGSVAFVAWLEARCFQASNGSRRFDGSGEFDCCGLDDGIGDGSNDCPDLLARFDHVCCHLRSHSCGSGDALLVGLPLRRAQRLFALRFRHHGLVADGRGEKFGVAFGAVLGCPPLLLEPQRRLRCRCGEIGYGNSTTCLAIGLAEFRGDIGGIVVSLRQPLGGLLRARGELFGRCTGHCRLPNLCCCPRLSAAEQLAQQANASRLVADWVHGLWCIGHFVAGSSATLHAHLPAAPVGFPVGLRLQPPLPLLVSNFLRLGGQGFDFALRRDEFAPKISAAVFGFGFGALLDDGRDLGRHPLSAAPLQTALPLANCV